MKKVILLGDSLCAQKSLAERPETGWGEQLGAFLSGGWTVVNLAVNGYSTKSAISEGMYEKALAEAGRGDVALIQFGHNDEKSDDVLRYAAPWSTFIANLKYMAGGLQKKGAKVVFITPVARRRFEGSYIVDTHKDYPAAMKCAAAQLGIDCIDMTIPTMILYQKNGESESKKFVMNFGGMLYTNYPDGCLDDTHLRATGAAAVARMIAQELKPLIPGLVK